MSGLKLVLRGLARSPVFTAVAIGSLALGIGANTAIFSLLQQVMLRTLPVQNPHELVYLYSPGPWPGSRSTDEDGGPSFSYPLFQELQEQQTPFVGLAGARNYSATIASGGEARFGRVRVVSGNYFSLLGVRPSLGRLIGEDDDRTPGAHPVAVLGYSYWESRFGADVGILNRTILINSSPFTVIGVAQKGFGSERTGEAPPVYIPVAMWDVVNLVDEDAIDSRRYAWITMFGRLMPDVSLERAEAEINVPYRAQVEQDAALFTQAREEVLERFRERKITLKPGEHGRGGLREDAGEPFMLMSGMTLLVLLLACANVANLQLARGAARLEESAVRLAIGASRFQLVKLFLLESIMLALAGGLLGLAAAQLTMRGILEAVPSWRGVGFVSTDLDAGALLFCLGLSIVAGIAFGLYPALRTSSVSLAPALKSQAGQASLPPSAITFRKALVTAQVAITLLLLITSGLFVSTLGNLARVDLGLRTDHLATFSLSPRMNRYDAEQIRTLDASLTRRLASIPGVELVTPSLVPAVARSTSRTRVAIEGFAPDDDQPPSVHVNWVGADYFRALGIPLMVGREFSPGDQQTTPKVAIVNQAFVNQYLEGSNALGKTLTRNETPYRIVGVVRDATYAYIRRPPPPTFYLAFAQRTEASSLRYYLRTSVQPESVFPAIREQVAALDAAMPIRGLKTMEAQLEEQTYAERILSTLTGAFALLAMSLAAMGLYGVLAYNVARRRREIGIRMALGARSWNVRKLVAREVAFVMFLGTVLGLAASAAVGRLLQPILFGLEPWDALTYAAAVALLWLAATAAAYAPTRRATHVEPIAALRYE